MASFTFASLSINNFFRPKIGNCFSQSFSYNLNFSFWGGFQTLNTKISHNFFNYNTFSLWGRIQPMRYSTPINNFFMPTLNSNFSHNSINNYNFCSWNSNQNMQLDTFYSSTKTDVVIKDPDKSEKDEKIYKPSSTKRVTDGTSVTISGIDYSIFGNCASQVKQLRPLMQEKMEKIFIYAKEKGWEISFTEAFRTRERQQELYDYYSSIGLPNRAAPPGSSRHEFGCAVDLKVDGSSKNEKTKELGEYAKSIGMRWGGDWSNNYEPWHFDINPEETPKATIDLA